MTERAPSPHRSRPGVRAAIASLSFATALGLVPPAWADLDGLGGGIDGDELGAADGGGLEGDLDLPSEKELDAAPDDPLGVDASQDPVDPGLVDPAFDTGIPGGGDPDFDPELPGPGD